MPEPWLLVPPGGLAAGELELEPEEARHLRSVLRRPAGTAVVLTDGRGGRAGGVVRTVERGRVVVAVDRVERVPRPPAPGLTLALGVLHGQGMDRAVTGAVELGVERLVPVVTARSQGGGAAAAGRLGHWRRAARQALKQCHRVWEMELAGPVDLDRFLDETAGAPGVVADPGGVSPDEVGRAAGGILLVGPEGGFTQAERAGILDAGWTPVRLGAHVLRAETAALVGVAVLALCRPA